MFGDWHPTSRSINGSINGSITSLPANERCLFFVSLFGFISFFEKQFNQFLNGRNGFADDHQKFDETEHIMSQTKALWWSRSAQRFTESFVVKIDSLNGFLWL